MSPLLKGEEKWNMSLQGTEDGETPTFKMKVPSQMLSYVLMEWIVCDFFFLNKREIDPKNQVFKG